MLSPDRARRSPGDNRGPVQSIELAGVDKAERTAHNHLECATCLLGIQPWTLKRRAEELTYAAAARRRICDLPEVP